MTRHKPMVDINATARVLKAMVVNPHNAKDTEYEEENMRLILIAAGYGYLIKGPDCGH